MATQSSTTKSSSTAPKTNYAAPQYTPVSGVGTKSNGYTFTGTTWVPTAQSTVKKSSAGGLMSVVPKSSLNKTYQSVVPKSSIQTSTRAVYSGVSGSSTNSASKVNLQTPTVTQSKVQSITPKSPQSTFWKNASVIGGTSGVYNPTITATKNITPQDLSANYAEVPITEQDNTDYSSIINNISPNLPDGTPKTPVEQPKQEKSALEQYVAEYAKLKQPDEGALYNEALAQSGLTESRNQVNQLTEKLNAITSRAQAQQLSLVGQGRGIPEAIIGGQQAQIGREAAIEALPVSALLNAAQGNYEMATQNFNTLYKIKVDQAEREYNSNLNVLNVAYQYATAKEKAELDKKAKEEERAYNEKKENASNSTKVIGDIFGLMKDGVLDQETAFQYAGALQDGSMTVAQVYKKLSGNNEPSIYDTLEAISSIESGGNYQAVSAPSKNGDRAYGRYQIMGNNIPSWSKDVLGKSLSIQAFLNNPSAQDAIAAKKLQAAKDKYGTWEDAASVWFTGKPLATAGNPSDIYGTTNNMYQERFARELYKNVKTSVKKASERPFGATLEAIAELGNAPDKTKQRNLKQLQDYIDAKDYKSAYQLSINRISDNLPTAEEKKQFSEKLSAIPAAENLKAKLEAYQNEGGDMGLLKGGIDKVSERLGKVQDSKYKTLAVDLKLALQEYRQRMSGAAFSEQEAREYASVNPSGGKSFALNIAILDGMINSFKRSTDSVIENKAPGLKYIREYAQYQGLKPDDLVISYTKNNPGVKSSVQQMISQGISPEVIAEALGISNLLQ